MKRFPSLVAALLMAAASIAQTSGSSVKLSPWLNDIASAQQGQTVARRAAAHEGASMEVLAKLQAGADEQTVMARYGATVERRIGRVLIVRVPIINIYAMAQDADVVRLEAERMPHPTLDVMPQQIGADKVVGNTTQQLPQAYTGKGVVVGIVDSGFDYTNPFFHRADGSSRIVWAADYLTGNTYATTAEVEAALHSSDATTMYHGTHVAAIAAGSRVNDINDVSYQGIATEADIAQGAVDSEITDQGLSSVTSIKAFHDIFDYASQHEQPCVINYSMGDAMTFSDSRQLEEEAIATLLQTPGRAIVVSAGNSGSTRRLAHKTATETEGGCGVWFNEDEQYGTYFGIEVKMQATQTLRLRYMNSVYSANKGELTFTADELDAAAQATTAAAKPLLGTKRLTVQLREKQDDGTRVYYITAGATTTFSTSDRILVTVMGEGDAWLYADPLCAQFENVPSVACHSLAEDGYSMAWPASMSEVITVGNVAHRFKIVTLANKYGSQSGQLTTTDLTPYESTKGEGYLARSSSVGPTLKETVKPDVCAPGVNIVSAMNFFINDNTYDALAAWDMSALDTDMADFGSVVGYYHVMAQTGTSMSAPAVTGTIALWMQADPTLTTDRIKDIIAHSSRQPDSDLAYPNNQYGFGEIDAYRGLLYMLDPQAVLPITRHQPEQAAIRLHDRQLTVVFGVQPTEAFTVSVYSTDGRQLLQRRNASVLDLSLLPQGVYAVQVSTGHHATTGSTLIRIR